MALNLRRYGLGRCRSGQAPFPWVRGEEWDSELCLSGGATILITSYARNSFLELAGGSRVYVSRAKVNQV